MSRPEYLNCIMTPGVIRGIREKQAAYDANPEEYERQEHQREEERRREQQELVEMQRKENDNG